MFRWAPKSGRLMAGGGQTTKRCSGPGPRRSVLGCTKSLGAAPAAERWSVIPAMAKRARLGDADEMFRRFFDRWYDDDARKLKGFEATRPDMMEVPEYVGQPVTEVCPLTEAAASEATERV